MTTFSVPTTAPATLAPIQQSERIHILDILRGFAIFGILAVNIGGFAAPIFLPGYTPPAAATRLDALAHNLVLILAEGKFYTIFAFLFGLGFSVQLARAETKGRDIRSFYPRRLVVLFIIGVLHSILFWTGDILRLYALLGFVLLLFRRRSNRTLLVWAGVFYALSFVLIALFGGPTGSGTAIPGYDLVGMARGFYTGPSYLDVVVFQAILSPFTFVFLLLAQGASVMALFLLGLLAGRAGVFEHLPENRPLWRRGLWMGLAAGVAGGALLLTDSPWLTSLGYTLSGPGLAAVYICGLSLLSLRAAGARLLSPLGAVGRMALTNYVLQSVICTLLFGGFAFGLYERVGAAGLLAITALIYAAQIPLSNWWLRRYRFGPLEWVWRSLTYRQRQPWRVAAAA